MRSSTTAISEYLSLLLRSTVATRATSAWRDVGLEALCTDAEVRKGRHAPIAVSRTAGRNRTLRTTELYVATSREGEQYASPFSSHQMVGCGSQIRKRGLSQICIAQLMTSGSQPGAPRYQTSRAGMHCRGCATSGVWHFRNHPSGTVGGPSRVQTVLADGPVSSRCSPRCKAGSVQASTEVTARKPRHYWRVLSTEIWRAILYVETL